jgi:hypothetical protein
VAGGSIRKLTIRGCLCALTWLVVVGWPPGADQPIACQAAPPADPAGRSGGAPNRSTLDQRRHLLDSLPLDRLTAEARQRILSVTQSPTIYRRLPAQAIDCEREMFLLLTRNPEVLVGIWDLMGITKVKTNRVGPYQLDAEDGIGTRCRVDLVYGDPELHIYVADGTYDGRLVAKPVRGRAVFVLRSSYARASDAGTTVTGSLDCFIQFDSLGADLVARTLSPLIGRSADHNFIETARFIAQISGAAERNPAALIELAGRIPQVSPTRRRHLVDVITTISRRHADRLQAAGSPSSQTDHRSMAGDRPVSNQVADRRDVRRAGSAAAPDDPRAGVQPLANVAGVEPLAPGHWVPGR